MTTFSEQPAQPAAEAHRPAYPDVGTARGYLITNLLALPGLGTIAAGQRAGYVQAAMAVAGFVLTLIWGVRFFVTWIQTGYFVCAIDTYFLIGISGASLFLVAWGWALRSSLKILRKARTQAKPA